MKKVILYGIGKNYTNNLNQIRLMEAAGSFEVTGITAKDLPAGRTLDGWRIVPREELPELSFDYVLLTAVHYEKEIIRELTETYGVARSSIIPFSVFQIPYMTFPLYESIRSRRISIFSNTCLGGFLSHQLRIEHRSPFKKLWMTPEDYLAFLREPAYYLSLTPVFHKWHKRPASAPGPLFPELKLGGLSLYCNHDDDPDKAIADWLRRAQKVNFNDLYVFFVSDSPSLVKRFFALGGYSRMYGVAPFSSDDPRVITIPPDEKEDYVGRANHFAINSDGPYSLVRLFTDSTVISRTEP